MAFRGYFALDGEEIANSTRTASHIGVTVPTQDLGVIDFPVYGISLVEDPPGSGLYIPDPLEELDPGLYDPETLRGYGGLYNPDGSCQLVEVSPLMYELPESCAEVTDRLFTPPAGSRRYGPGLYEVVPTCWEPLFGCGDCRTTVQYDDSWPGLHDFLGDNIYRPELAPWYSTRAPESAEFFGVWVMDVQGLDTTPVTRQITELVGSGAAAGPARDGSRVITFEAVLFACTNAGLQYGLSWLTCALRATNASTESVLKFLAAHPSETNADPEDLVREVRRVVLTRNPEVKDAQSGGGRPNRQATQYRVTWEMTALSPYMYMPPIDLDVTWDDIVTEQIEWVHSADCVTPNSCIDMPVLFSATCEIETVDIVTSPPPSCGGCLPVCSIDSYIYAVPTLDYPTRCRETAVTTTIHNASPRELTLQAYWRPRNTFLQCDVQWFPLQIAGLPPTATIILDGVSGRYWAELEGRRRKPRAIVGTPTGAPWRPPLIDREQLYDFVVRAPTNAEFTVSFQMIDREP